MEGFSKALGANCKKCHDTENFGMKLWNLALTGGNPFNIEPVHDHPRLSVRTVDSHLYRVYTKLGVRDRASLAAALAR